MSPEEKALALLREIIAYDGFDDVAHLRAPAKAIIAEADRAGLIERAREILAKHVGFAANDRPDDHPVILAMVEALETKP